MNRVIKNESYLFLHLKIVSFEPDIFLLNIVVNFRGLDIKNLKTIMKKINKIVACFQLINDEDG